MWVSGIEPKLSGFVANAFTQQAIFVFEVLIVSLSL